MKTTLFILSLFFWISIATFAQPVPTSSGKTVRYDLYIADTTVTLGETPTRAIAVNGQIPMPTLEFTEGDTAEICMHNNLDEETYLHWHGLFLPNGNEPESGSVGIRINGNGSIYLSSVEFQSLQ